MPIRNKSSSFIALRGIHVTAMLLLLISLIACATPVQPPAPAPAQPQPPAATAVSQPKRGGSLVIRWWSGDPPDLDPYLNTSFRSQEFAAFFYSRLLKFDNGPD